MTKLTTLLGIVLAAGAALASVASPALADVAGVTSSIPAGEAVTSVTTVTAPVGSWALSIAQWLNSYVVPVAIPIVAGAVTAGITRVSPLAAMFLSQSRIEQMLSSGVSYGMNATVGAVRGKALSADVGNRVLASGLNYVLANAPAAVIKAADGPEGVAKRLFRTLNLDEQAHEGNVLKPVLAGLQQQGVAKRK